MNTGVSAATNQVKVRSWLGPVLIAAAITAAYANSFRGAFQFDDIPAILENPTLRQLWPPAAPLHPPPGGGITVSGRPILNLSLALNYAVSGYHSWSYHAANLLIHLGAALVLFGVVRRTLAAQGKQDSFGAALAVALIWSVHPLTTEAVTYIVQRAESLMALCYLFTLYCFIRSTRVASTGGSLRWKTLGVLACWIGVGTKEVIVSAPVAVLLYDRLFVAGSWRAAWRAGRGFYLALAASWIPLTWLVAGTGWDRGGTFRVGIAWGDYWLSQGEAWARYLKLAFWPNPLVFDYGPPSAPPVLAWTLAMLALVAVAGTLVAIVRGRRGAFLAGAFCLVLAPTSVVPGALQFAVEHRMYLPLAAVVTAVVLGARAAAGHLGISGPALNRGAVTLLALMVAGLGILTVKRNRIYADELALWMDTVMKRPASALAEANVGKALLDRGHFAEGTRYCAEAVRLDPGKPLAHYNLGMAYEVQQRWSDALDEFVAAAKLNPGLYYAEFRAGRLLDRLGRPAEAESCLRRALAAAPELAEAHGSLGVALGLQGRPEEADAEYGRSLALNPDQPDVEFDLALSLAGRGRIGDAVVHYIKAVGLKPKYAEAWLNLGVALAQSDRLEEARSALQTAVRLRPGSPEAHENLATVLDLVGRTAEAVAEFREALRLRPDYAEAHYNLGNTQIRARNLAAARAEFSAALRLRPDFGAAREMLERLAALPIAR